MAEVDQRVICRTAHRVRLARAASVLAGVMLSGAMMPRAWAHSKEATISIKTYLPIEIDGRLDDWTRRVESANWTAKMAMKKGQVLEWIRAVPAYLNMITSKVESGMISGPNDLAVAVYTLWDEKTWYIAATVTDDQVVTQHDGENIWQDDAVELWLDCRHDAVTHTLFQDDEYQLGFSPASQYRNNAIAWAWRNPKSDAVIKSAQIASALVPGGYIIEASVPWAVLQGCSPTVGGMIGFNISVVDKDEDQLWSHVTWSGQLHSDPSQFGHLYFMDAPVDLFPADVFEKTDERPPWDARQDSPTP